MYRETYKIDIFCCSWATFQCPIVYEVHRDFIQLKHIAVANKPLQFYAGNLDDKLLYTSSKSSNPKFENTNSESI